MEKADGNLVQVTTSVVFFCQLIGLYRSQNEMIMILQKSCFVMFLMYI